ncbi:MAG TPA: hypothetical protein VK745_13585 [Polyangiaceae bacterium]|nr:hypothetical protein [Polyangiaceae bacterium]
MKIGVLLLGVLGSVGCVAVASAQEAPRARLGFQMDVRTGYSLALGKFNQAAKMSDLASGQVPIIMDIGGKVIPELFLGGYLGLGFGGAAGETKAACDLNGGSCIAIGVHLGIEAQYQILPAGAVDPWLGYGFGFESQALSQSNDSNSATSTVSYGGFEFARLMAGVDVRVNRVFGVGPFLDLSFARYSTISQGSQSQDIPDPATHEWLTVGARFLFFP